MYRISKAKASRTRARYPATSRATLIVCIHQLYLSLYMFAMCIGCTGLLICSLRVYTGAMLNRSQREESLYHRVADFVRRRGCATERQAIEDGFPDVDPKKIAKAIENASYRRLIHYAGHGRYKAGPKPEAYPRVRNQWPSQEELDAMARSIVPAALNSRTPIENAWFQVARSRSGAALAA